MKGGEIMHNSYMKTKVNQNNILFEEKKYEKQEIWQQASDCNNVTC